MKKILLIADMEGCLGVYDMQNYEQCKIAMENEIDHVIKTIKDSCDCEITILDCHNDGCSLIDYASKNKINYLQHVWSLKNSASQFNCAFMIGFHPKNASKGYFPHTIRADIVNLFLGEKNIGEIGLVQNCLAFYGIPVIYISGDYGILDELNDFKGEVCIVKNIDLPNEGIDIIKTKISFSIAQALKSDFKPKYNDSLTKIQLVNPERLQFFPKEIFTIESDLIVFKNTMELIDSLLILCDFLNVAEAYYNLRIQNLKNTLSLLNKDVILKDNNARQILSNKDWKSITDDEFSYLITCAKNALK